MAEKQPQQQQGLFTRLTRLFSTDVVIRNVGGNQLKVIDTDRIQAYGNIKTNALIDRFTKLHRYGANMPYNPTMNYQTLRIQLYTDYEAMDTESIIASTLDIIADEATLKNEAHEVVQIRSSDENIQRILYNLFYDVLNIEFNIWPWIRTLCKYGDHFLKLEISENYGIINVIPISPYEMTREEGFDPENPFRVKFKHEGLLAGQLEYENYEIAHFRLVNDPNFLPYGKSIIESGRRVWKQLQLMEDAMLIHRIMRAPEKRIFRIDTGNIPPNETKQYMKSVINEIKKIPYIDPRTGDYNLKYNMMNMTEDFFIPVRGGDSGTSIESLPGLEYNAIEDIEYLRNKMMSALKIPKAFLGYEEGICISPETKIPLLSGEIKSALELIQDYNDNIKNYVYSIDESTKSIVAGEIEWAGMTRMNAKVVKVTLDNDESIVCTPDHNFMLRDGTWVEAQFLKETDSLMPLYLSKSKNKKMKDYTTVYNPPTNKYELVHKLVAKQFNIKQKGKVIHHKDFNKHNNTPENLDGSMTWNEHALYHREMSKLGNESLEMNKYNEKYSKFDINILKNIANECDSFQKLESKINVDRNTLNKIFEYNKIDKFDFIKMYMPLALKNTAFMNNFKIINHKVKSVEFLLEPIDTCDITIKKYHNFGTLAGVIIHNSGKATLAAEDVRFARTIERIQKIFVSELSKIAVIHLYAQGFEDADIVNFELSLTNPSTIYEQEKVSLWQEKVSLVRDMQEVKMLSNDWIYKNILNFSQDEIEQQKIKVLDDIKNTFRMGQIENEGNDPYITHQTFGTPHDLAMMYKGKKTQEEKPIDFGTTNFKMNWDDSTNITDDKDYDKNYNENQREKSKSKYGQDSHIRGRDPIGAQQYNKSINPDKRKTKVNYSSNINKESLNSMLNAIKSKKLIKESLKTTDVEDIDMNSDDKTYLDENNLLEL